MNNFQRNIYRTAVQNSFVYVTQIEVTADGGSTPNAVLNYILQNGGATSQTLNYIPEGAIQTKIIQINACVEEGSIFVSPEVVSVVVTYNNSIIC